MANEDTMYTIVVGIDFSEASTLAIDHAIDRAREKNAELHVLYVDDHFRAPEGGREAAEAALARIEKYGIARTQEVERKTGRSVAFRHLYSHFRIGAPAEQIAQLAVDLDADLIVVGTHGLRGFQRLLMGSVSEKVVHLARCPVWVVRPKDHENIGKVPEIEPPCKDCLAKRAETNNAVFWCSRHSEHHIRARPFHTGGPDGSGAESYSSTPT